MWAATSAPAVRAQKSSLRAGAAMVRRQLAAKRRSPIVTQDLSALYAEFGSIT
jgi:hypothetical protein